MKNVKVKLRTVKQWSVKDYVSTISTVFLNYIILVGLLVFSVFINTTTPHPTPVSFVEYFTDDKLKFLYLALIYLLFCAVIYIYFFFERRDFLKEPKNIEMIFAIMEISLVLCILFGKYLHVNARPIVVCALLVMTLVDRNSSLFVNFIFCVLMYSMDISTNAVFYSGSMLVDEAAHYSLVTGFIAGTVGIYFVSFAKSRLGVSMRGISIMIANILCVIFLVGFNTFTDWRMLVYALESGVLSVVLYLAFLPIFEGIFRKITKYRLAELTDHDSRIIKKLIDEAPGTFNHTVIVANLTEQCAAAIGEDSLLARACAYYHDIGKLKEPKYFAENINDGVNVHNDLTPELSTQIIRAHVQDGYDMAKYYHLPDEIANACREHHGTMPIKYFYAKALKFTTGELDIEKYSYAGPKPQSKIAAILMIADSSEAAVRALTQRDRDSVDEIIQQIIDERLDLGQFNECPITMQDLYIIKNTLINSLTGVYHSRIKYPKIKLTDESFRQDE